MKILGILIIAVIGLVVAVHFMSLPDEPEFRKRGKK